MPGEVESSDEVASVAPSEMSTFSENRRRLEQDRWSSQRYVKCSIRNKLIDKSRRHTLTTQLFPWRDFQKGNNVFACGTRQLASFRRFFRIVEPSTSSNK